MDGASESTVVALFKASAESDSEEPKDRYISILKANNYSGVSVPCLSFQFQIDQLRQCLATPEKYSGKYFFKRHYHYVPEINKELHTNLGEYVKVLYLLF